MSDKNIATIDYFTINFEEINRNFLSQEDFEDNELITIDCVGSGGNGGNNDDGTTTGADDDDNQSGNRAQVPDDIFVPKYLADYLNNLVLPNQIENKFLIKVGEDALKKKIADVEQDNMSVKGNTLKQRLPTKLEFDEVADIMMSIFTFKNIQMTERVEDTLLAVYDHNKNSAKRGTYNPNSGYFYEMMERLAPNFKRHEMDEVLHKIERSISTVEQTKERHLFAVKNGIYNRQTRQLMPFDSKYVYLTKIPVDYKLNPMNPVLTAPDGYKWDVESWIRDITDNDADTTTLIWQVIADCLQPNYSRHKSIWFYSEKGNNGKGTVGQLIKNILGKGNYSSLSVTDFKHEFLRETLLGVAANIADENDVSVFIDSVKDYKASVTGDDININRKYQKPLRIQFNGTNIQMMNGLPKTKDKTESFYRRIILVPFMKSFTNNGEREYIKSDYIKRKEVLEYVLHKALDMDFDEYIVPQRSAEVLDSYREKNNPVLEFWNEYKEQFVWDLLPTQFLYDLFVKWHERNNPSGKVMSKRTFTDDLLAVVQAQGDPWVDKTGQNKKIQSKGKMDDDEPLITEFGLDRHDRSGKATPWMCPDYNGDNSSKKREFPRMKEYRGLLRA